MPGEPRCEFRRDDVTWSAELRDHGGYAVETQIFRNGEFVIAAAFRSRISR
jgi:hypothetical protein